MLQLSRTDRTLNEWLKSSDAASVWVASRRNLVLYIPKTNSYFAFYGDSDDEEAHEPEYESVSMPEKPANLSEISYARLLFDKNCHVRI